MSSTVKLTIIASIVMTLAIIGSPTEVKVRGRRVKTMNRPKLPIFPEQGFPEFPPSFADAREEAIKMVDENRRQLNEINDPMFSGPPQGFPEFPPSFADAREEAIKMVDENRRQLNEISGASGFPRAPVFPSNWVEAEGTAMRNVLQEMGPQQRENVRTMMNFGANQLGQILSGRRPRSKRSIGGS